jgi:ABC-2 type transport system ATP-binding protein
MNAVEIRNVSKSFGRQVAVDDLSLDVRRESVFGFLGPNGAGKTTTIRMLVDIYGPDSGSIRVFGDAPSEDVRRRVGYLPEERGIYQRMKVLDELRFFAELRGIGSAEAARRIDEWIARLELQPYREKRVADLSKGTQQKLQFIVSVLHDPELLILDEPFSGLDPVSVETMKAAIAELRRRGKTIIFSTHQMEQVEQLCDDLCLIDRGRALLSGSVQQVKRAHPRRVVRLVYEGQDGFLGRFPAERVVRLPTHTEILLENENEPQELLRTAVAVGTRITRFEVAEASLHDIFVMTVKGSHVPDSGDRQA